MIFESTDCLNIDNDMIHIRELTKDDENSEYLTDRILDMMYVVNPMDIY